jgi:glycerol-3-phosphate acyltransferase PlsX
MSLPRIALDAMGTDAAPVAEVEGAVLAARERLAEIVLVGREDVVKRELARRNARGLALEIVPAAEVISMDEEPARAFRRKRDSSIRVAARLVREGQVQGFISAGSTGATMTAAKITLGTLEGVERPALAALMPTAKGTPTIVLDVGANAECSAHNLEQFAVMGEVFARVVLGFRKPRVGLLSSGEEATKGTEVVREAHRRLCLLPLNFVGNVEGRDLCMGRVDVIVTDGFTGNVALKTSEGVAQVLTGWLKEALSSTVTAKVGYVLARRALGDFKKRADYTEYGGAPLLGVRGFCMVCHGGSNSNAIKNAIRVAAEFVRGRVNEKIERELTGTAMARS